MKVSHNSYFPTIRIKSFHNTIYSRKGTVFDNFWQLLTNFDNFWQLLTTFDNFCQILTTFANFCQLLTYIWHHQTCFWHYQTPLYKYQTPPNPTTHAPDSKRHHQTRNARASPLVHHLWCIYSGASPLDLWCITSHASPLLHHLCCITCGAYPLVYLLWCTSSGASPLVNWLQWCISDSSTTIIFVILESYHFQKYSTT